VDDPLRVAAACAVISALLTMTVPLCTDIGEPEHAGAAGMGALLFCSIGVVCLALLGDDDGGS
jgi:hypothetical protein